MSYRVVILASGTGTLAQALIQAWHRGEIEPASLLALGVDRPCPALDMAKAEGLATFAVYPADFPSRADWDQGLAKAVAAFTPDLVVSAGFMRVLGAGFLEHFGDRTINTHPALLPHFPGAHAVRDALAAGVTTTGCTVHQIDAGVDTGPVIQQRPVQVLPGDDEATLHERIKVQERAMLIETVAGLASGAIRLPGWQPRPAGPVFEASLSHFTR
jgi:phosphoribosylglycinamide formyltransferase-1